MQALAFATGASFLLALAGCHPAAQQAPPAQPPLPVTVSHPLTKQVIDYDEYPARLSAVDSVDIRARVSGYLNKVNFKDGMMVKKGDLLFVIDPRPYQAEVDRLQAELARSQTQLDLANSDDKRGKELFGQKALSGEELDTRGQTQKGAEAAVKSAQASLETAQLNLAYTNISAPIDGRLSRRMVTEGNLIVGDGNNSTLLTTLVSIDPIYAYVDVDEAAVLRYQEANRNGLTKAYGGSIPAEIALGNNANFAYKGVIDFIDNQIDPTTGTLHTRAVFANPDHNLIPGQFARMRISGSPEHEGLLIPDYAIGSDQEKKIVYVIGEDHMVQVKQIVPGQMIDGLRVIRSGLEQKDLVVLDHLQMMRGGMPVSPTEQPLKASPETADAAPDTAHP